MATDKKIGGPVWSGLVRSGPVLLRRSGVAGGALPVHTDAFFAAVFGAVCCAYSCSFVKS